MSYPVERWRLVEDVFNRALNEDPTNRKHFLETACADDPDLYQEVSSLLASLENADDSLENLVQRTAMDVIAEQSAVGRRVGNYRLVDEIGRGGMGVVYRAERADGAYQQQVAIKLIKTQVASDQVLQRFVAERQILAQLDHPSIARLLDGGTLEDGTPFLVMEYIEGQPLGQWCRENRHDIENRVRLLVEVCGAIESAHRQQIVHRDLKPSNILVTAEGRIKLIDFGIAKLLRENESGLAEEPADTLTLPSQRVLTPAYASPEQVLGGTITAASDIYTLGLLLYRLLTGLSAQTPAGRGFEEIAKVVCTQDPERPSAAVRRLEKEREPLLAEITASRSTSSKRLAQQFDGDLDRIIIKALRKEPEQRYPSAALLAEDLQRWLDGHPARARRGNLRYWAGKLMRRRVATGTALVFALVLATFLVVLQLTDREGPAIATSVVARPSVAVLDFHQISGESESAWLGTVIAELLSSSLAAGEALRVVPRRKVARVLVEAKIGPEDSIPNQDLDRLVSNLGAELILRGSYTQIAEGGMAQLRIDCTLADRSGTVLAQLSETGSQDELPELVARLGARLYQTLGVAPVSPAKPGQPASQALNNTEVARLYAAGLDALRHFDSLRARDQLVLAVTADPGFALGHRALAMAWSDLGYQRRAREAVGRAFELAADLPRADRLAVEAEYYQANGDSEQAVEIYRTRWMLYPDDPETALDLAIAQTAAGRGSDALQTLARLGSELSGSVQDPRIDLAEAEAAGSVSDFHRQQAAASRAAAAGREQGATLLVARARLSEWWALRNLGELDRAASAAAEASELFSVAGNRGGVAQALNARATVLADLGQLKQAIDLDLQALEIFRKLGDRRHISWSLNNLGRFLRARGDFSGARRMYQESLAICLEIDDQSGVARAQANLGRLLVQSGELAQAQELHLASLGLRRQIGEARGIAGAVLDLGVVYLARGKLIEAISKSREAADRFLAVGDKQSAAHAFGFLGDALLARGELSLAETAFQQALSFRTELGLAAAFSSRLALARVALAQGRAAIAAAKLEDLLTLEGKRALGPAVAMAEALLAVAWLEQGDLVAAQAASLTAQQSSNRHTALAERLGVEILLARVDGLSGKDQAAALEKALVAATAAGLKGLELEARLVVAELALAADLPNASRDLAALAITADDAGFGLIAKRARNLQTRATNSGP